MVFLRNKSSKTGINSSIRVLIMQNIILTTIITSFYSFAKHIVGIIFKPYETYRELTESDLIESIYVAILIFAYVGLASILRKGLGSGPLFLTMHFGKLLTGIIFTFIFSWGTLYFTGRFFGGKGTAGKLFLPWIYTLIPTLCWFILTSFFYFILPPPRTTQLMGQIFSIFFVALSLTLFFWKGILYYLTLRMVHKLDLIKILLVSAVVFPLGIIYSLFTYKIGLFRIPFI